jgi:hypothetical protein
MKSSDVSRHWSGRLQLGFSNATSNGNGEENMNDMVLTDDAYKHFSLTEEMVAELQGLINVVMFGREPNALIVVELACEAVDLSRLPQGCVKQFSNGEKVYINGDYGEEFAQRHTDPVAFAMIKDAARAGRATAVLFRGNEFMLLPLGVASTPLRVAN